MAVRKTDIFARQFSSPSASGRWMIAVVLLLVKEAVLAGVLFLLRNNGAHLTCGTVTVIIGADLLLTALLFVLARRFNVHALLRRDVSYTKLPGKKRALVSGTGVDAIALARIVESRGRYSVVGFLTPEKELDGSFIDGRPVFFCDDFEGLKRLHWRFGGISNILFPMDWEHAALVKDQKGGEA